MHYQTKKTVKEKSNAFTKNAAFDVELKIDTWIDRKASKENQRILRDKKHTRATLQI